MEQKVGQGEVKATKVRLASLCVVWGGRLEEQSLKARQGEHMLVPSLFV